MAVHFHSQLHHIQQADVLLVAFLAIPYLVDSRDFPLNSGTQDATVKMAEANAKEARPVPEVNWAMKESPVIDSTPNPSASASMA